MKLIFGCRLLLLIIIVTNLHAKSFGVIGEAFSVAEMSLLKFIETRLTGLEQRGELNTINQHWVARAAKHTNRPAPLNLPRAITNYTHYYQPTIVLAQAITDIAGKVLYPAGLKLNALEKLPAYAPCWLFFNADDKAQVLWVLTTTQQAPQSQQCHNPKLILTGGAVRQAEKIFNAPIYFDQSGKITHKLAILTIPALVTRENNQLRIDEIAIKENGYAL